MSERASIKVSIGGIFKLNHKIHQNTHLAKSRAKVTLRGSHPQDNLWIIYAHIH